MIAQTINLTVLFILARNNDKLNDYEIISIVLIIIILMIMIILIIIVVMKPKGSILCCLQKDIKSVNWLTPFFITCNGNNNK